MTKKEIFHDACKGIVIDADNLDDVYEVFEPEKLYKLVADRAEGIMCDLCNEDTHECPRTCYKIKEFRKRMEIEDK